ncbi:dienelactone hydrolase family protein [Gymnodinialimonas sp. 2305UL16-5]|uniref:alpha/beta hydrolase n=1 Tax=Gymnodinialimonas mytili TaxID=3126503 RepID=UPI0030AE559A
MSQHLAPLALGGAAPDRARYGLVLVHGRGGTAADILGLGDALALPDVARAAPQAEGRSWWPTSFLAPHDQVTPFVEAGLSAIEEAIETLVQTGLPRSRIALAGFSQGACLALEYAARRGDVMAVFGLSGGLVGTGDAEGRPSEALYGHGPKRFDYSTSLKGTKAYISVHDQDPHIPRQRAQDSADIFHKLGAETTLHILQGAGHGITETDITALRAALNQ